MMDLAEKFQKIGVVPVVVLEDVKDAVPLAEALVEGGLPCAEVTFRTEAAEESIRLMAEQFPDMLVGAGTVLTKEQVDAAAAAGAKFIVSPGFDPEIVDYCLEKEIPVYPGCVSPSEVAQAVKRGLKYLQGQVTAAHGIQKIKTDREFRSVSAVYPLTQKFLWAVECHIHGRSLHRDISKLHVDTVFLRYSIKAPGQIFLLLTNAKILLHPVPAPDAGIKIRLQTERRLCKLPESIPESLACHQLRMILFFRLQHIIKGLVPLFFIAVCQSPLDEKSDLIFRQNRRICIG